MKPTDHQEFEDSLRLSAPPSHWPEGLRALWLDARGDWEASHNIAQEMHSPLGSWIHAYLHRKEGDEPNARFWYGMANKSFSDISLDDEREEIVLSIISA